MGKAVKLVELYAQIGRRIRQEREKQGITLEELAERCGRDWSYLSQIERARSVPSIETLFLICEQLGIPMASLFSSEKPAAAYKTDPYSSKIIYLLKESSPKDKRIAVSVIKKIVNK